MDKPKTIVRPDKHGHPDDIVIDCNSIHLECMDRDWWHLAVYRGKKRITFAVQATINGKCVVRVIEDELGAVDDS